MKVNTETYTTPPRCAGGRESEAPPKQAEAKMLDIDLGKAMVPQVGKLGEEYWEWVHKPSSQKTYRLFAGDVYEFFSWTPWWMIPLVWGPLIYALCADALGYVDWNLSPLVVFGFLLSWPLSSSASWAVLSSLLPTAVDPPNATSASPESVDSMMDDAKAATAAHQWSHSSLPQSLHVVPFTVYFVAGLLLWSFLEYCLHRFLFHVLLWKDSPAAIEFHFILHGQHHKFPMDRGRLVFPPAAGLMMAIPFYITFHALLPFAAAANALTAGVFVGYVCYDLTHYYLHHGRPAQSYFKTLKRHHMWHHYKDSDNGFGISSKLWDYPFSTDYPPNPNRNSQTQKQ
eukprot:m.242406 g.242406  ORF g.242406 m.242406 type:complete len:342 (-) comp17135_c9_seq1:40-1065(-)